jgi:hypothetical protein
MKTFQQFQENIEQLRKGLETLERQSAPRERLAARRAAAKQRSRTLASDFQRRQKEKMQAQRERMLAQRERMRMQQREELQLEQTPTMKPNLYSQLVARRQASQKSALIKHAHQEMGAEARTQEAAHQARLKKLTGTP